MNHGIAYASARTVRAVAMLAVTVMLAVVAGAGVAAQTLTDPNPKTHSSPTPGTVKSLPAQRAKACGTYGDGFVQVPGTGACVKIGGAVTVEGTTHGY
jgi:uncharacterized membrane-anchored protein